MAYLRLTPEEYRALCRCCRSLDLRAITPSSLRALLIPLLSGDWPDLADRLAQLRASQLRLLLEHLREHPECAQDPQAARQARDRSEELSFEEFRAVAGAAQRFLIHDGRLSAFRAYLVQHFRSEDPTLARKLDQLSDRQLRGLFERVQRPRRWRA
ncbi:MAG: hypothetical protein L0Z62_47390 [Gemmataceae bacterium]|nr:hypothetical protein [Gemmataceae bacterium]